MSFLLTVLKEESTTRNEQARRVREMFATIAARYDLLNHLLSGNVDKRWRRITATTLVATLPRGDIHILDVACGTGDLSVMLFEMIEARVIGLDFCRPMLEIAARKTFGEGFSIPFIEGDALEIPFCDRSFDAVTIAFGLRNLASFSAGLAEFLRVLKPGGRVAVLEFSKPESRWFRLFFQTYFSKVLPFLGGLVSGSKGAYHYLPDSVSRFPDQKGLASIMKEVGFEQVTFQNLTGGIAALHMGRKPD